MNTPATPNQFLDKLHSLYTRQHIQSNAELVMLEGKLKDLKGTLGGKQSISPTGLLKRLIKDHLGV